MSLSVLLNTVWCICWKPKHKTTKATASKKLSASADKGFTGLIDNYANRGAQTTTKNHSTKTTNPLPRPPAGATRWLLELCGSNVSTVQCRDHHEELNANPQAPQLRQRESRSQAPQLRQRESRPRVPTAAEKPNEQVAASAQEPCAAQRCLRDQVLDSAMTTVATSAEDHVGHAGVAQELACVKKPPLQSVPPLFREPHP
jgi:hypothetical protein